jgi:hypothetical protein
LQLTVAKLVKKNHWFLGIWTLMILLAKRPKMYFAIITPWPKSVSELYRVSDSRLLAKLVLTFVDRGRHVVSETDRYGRNLRFLDRSRYFFLLSSYSVVLTRLSGPRPDPLLLRKATSAGNPTRISESVARNSNHQTIEAITLRLILLQEN